KGSSASSTTPPTPITTPTPTTTVVAAPRLSAAAKGKQHARATTPTEPTDVERTEAEQLKIILRRSRQETHISQQRGSGTDEGTGSKPGVPDVPSDDSEEELSWNSSNDEDVDEQTKGRDESEGDKTNESDDDDDQEEEAKKVTDDDDNEEEVPKIDEHETTESDEGDNEATESDRESEDEETREQDEESFDLIPRTPEDNEDDDNNEEDQGLRIGEEERMQEEEEADELYRDVDINQGRDLQQMPEAVREAVQTQTNRLQDSIQRENDEFLKTIDENMKKIIKEQVKDQVKAQVTRILPRIEEAVNAQLESEVLTRSSHSSRTSYAVAADLNLYKALVEAYDVDKTILDTYGESAILKRRREDDDQEGPSTGSDRGSKRRRGGGEHASASTLSEPATGSAGRSTTRTQSRQLSASESAFAEEPMQNTCQMEEPLHPVFDTGAEDQPIVQTSQHPEWFSQPKKPPTPDRDWNKSLLATQGDAQSWISALTKQTDACSSFNELLDTPIDFSNFIMNRLGVDTLTPELLAGPTYELMRGHEPISYNKHALWGVSHWGRKRHQFYGFAVNRESALDVYSKRRIIAGIRMQYLPTTIWRKGDKDRAAAMIQAIDKMLKTRRIMRSLERFVGGRQYEGDFRLLQRTI
nr:hypothetical protein [Tanacetum cinerariifolium]